MIIKRQIKDSFKFQFSYHNTLIFKSLAILVIFLSVISFPLLSKAAPLAEGRDKFLGNMVGGYPLYIPSDLH